MLRIDSIERASATKFEVIYSLSPANSTHPVWRKALVPDDANMLTTDWILRNQWARAERASLEETDATLG